MGLIDKLTPQNQRLFACDCAERALLREREAGREPDDRSWNAVRVAREYAMGRATDEELGEAESEAIDAASRTTELSSNIAAWAAAWAADKTEQIAADYSSDRVSLAFNHPQRKRKWQIAHATAYYEAQETAHPSLLSVLLQRKQIL